jgi:hypothetical protein
VELADNQTYTITVRVTDGHSAPVPATTTVQTQTSAVVLDWTKHYQTIEGFGGFGSQDVYWGSGPYTTPEFVRLVVEDLGLTIAREEVVSSLEPVNDNDDPKRDGPEPIQPRPAPDPAGSRFLRHAGAAPAGAAGGGGPEVYRFGVVAAGLDEAQWPPRQRDPEPELRAARIRAAPRTRPTSSDPNCWRNLPNSARRTARFSSAKWGYPSMP